MRLLFVNAHPDDVEFTCASTCQQAVALGWDVYEILMTSDEYGIDKDDFKGKRIKMIRKREMFEAAKVYGINSLGRPKINLIWFGEIDGYLKFNRVIFLRLRKKILKINPYIVISPDIFFSMDLHPDHKHTGWLTYLIIKSIEPSKRPLLLLYHSFNSNFYVPIKDISIQIKAWSKHESQTSPLLNKILKLMRKIFYFLRKRKSGHILAEGFRKVNFNKNENQLKKLRHKILYYIFANMLNGPSKDHYYPTPKELGLIF